MSLCSFIYVDCFYIMPVLFRYSNQWMVDELRVFILNPIPNFSRGAKGSEAFCEVMSFFEIVIDRLLSAVLQSNEVYLRC